MTFIEVILYTSALFQLGNNILFLWVAVTRLLHRTNQVVGDGLLLENALELDHPPRWLVVLPVLCEAEQLRKSMTCLLSHPECLLDIDIVVALDGKTQEDVDACFRVVTHVLCNHSGSIASRVHCVPTSTTVCGGLQRRKGEAINLVLSLIGKHCVWARMGSTDLLFVNDTQEELDERTMVLRQGYGDEVYMQGFNIPHADYLMVVDVDERVNSLAFKEFRTQVASMPDVTLVQCPKYDSPNSSTISSKAFAANYDSWFHWEAGWLESGGYISAPGCSYYGSMAAIAIEQLGYDRATIALNSGQIISSKSLFVEGYSVEDYVFYAKKLLGSRTALLSDTIAVGEAPASLAAWLSLWARWTYDNVSIFLRVILPALVNGKIVGTTKRLALLYHGASWFAYPNIALLGLFTSWYTAQARSGGGEYLGRLILFVLVLEVVRRFIIPSPRTSIADRACRFFAEVALFPVAALYVLAGIAKGYLSITVPIATPRTSADYRPSWWIVISYLVFSVIILSSSVQIFYRIHNSQKLCPLELASLLFAVWFIIGLSLVMFDEIAGALLQRAVKAVKTSL